MHIETSLAFDLLEVAADDELDVLIEITAPPAPETDRPTTPRTLVIALDRSGSMQGDRLDGAKTALIAIVDRLDPADNFGLVTFDTEVIVDVPVGPLTDKVATKRAIAEVFARGGTDLSAGYLRSLQEAHRVARAAGATVLLISDGHANSGIVDPSTLEGIAAKAAQDGVTTSTLGFGLGYDERIMSAIARGGRGNELFAEESDMAIKQIAGEVEGLLAQVAQAASVLVEMSTHVKAVSVLNDLPVSPTPGGIVIELGSFYADEVRRLLLTFAIPGVPALGPAEVATLTFTYVDLPTIDQHTISVPLHVNVVPGDAAAGRTSDPKVKTERAFLEAQAAKRRASELLSSGDTAGALSHIAVACAAVDAAMAFAPASYRDELTSEVDALAYLDRETRHGVTARAAKYSSMDARLKSTKRGRRMPSTEAPTSP